MQYLMRCSVAEGYCGLSVSPWQTDTGLLNAPHAVWCRVVADIPDFCRELVAALAEQ